mmetsp:Transcript_87244/g.182591  ORF Transcript_87244/g.182591 Transcript_87244/m.182591 type:complete len:310 (+) Transcript_87244:211-1140(+)
MQFHSDDYLIARPQLLSSMSSGLNVHPDLESVGEEDGGGDGGGDGDPVLVDASEEPHQAGLLGHSNHAGDHLLLSLEHLVSHDIERVGHHGTSDASSDGNLGRLDENGVLVVGINGGQVVTHVVLDHDGDHVLGGRLEDGSIETQPEGGETLGGGQVLKHGEVGEGLAGQGLTWLLDHDGRPHEGLVHGLSEDGNDQRRNGGRDADAESLLLHPSGAHVGTVEDRGPSPGHASDDDQGTPPRGLHGLQVLLQGGGTGDLIAGLADGCRLPQREERESGGPRGGEVGHRVAGVGRGHLERLGNEEDEGRV